MQRHLAWVTTAVHFAEPAQEAALLDYVHEPSVTGLREVHPEERERSLHELVRRGGGA